ncbi:hypothetical protein [Marivita sp.]|uniref:hypothetical protein n=1 Tax=Marivita sp. TaxID=2003365 RepID=UPI002632D9A3|nr:hypothetical protein [Marivita sp.]
MNELKSEQRPTHIVRSDQHSAIPKRTGGNIDRIYPACCTVQVVKADRTDSVEWHEIVILDRQIVVTTASHTETAAHAWPSKANSCALVQNSIAELKNPSAGGKCRTASDASTGGDFPMI